MIDRLRGCAAVREVPLNCNSSRIRRKIASIRDITGNCYSSAGLNIKRGAVGNRRCYAAILKIKRFAVKSMSADEATEQMELLSHDFFLFLNIDTGALNLVYRRKDGNYGLIEPELA